MPPISWLKISFVALIFCYGVAPVYALAPVQEATAVDVQNYDDASGQGQDNQENNPYVSPTPPTDYQGRNFNQAPMATQPSDSDMDEEDSLESQGNRVQNQPVSKSSPVPLSSSESLHPAGTTTTATESHPEKSVV